MFSARDTAVRRRRCLRGLTLLEVVVGLTILALMSGAIYAVVAGSIESTATLGQLQTEDRRTEAFVERCRVALANLPAGATVELKLLESEPLRQELTLRGVPRAFAWGYREAWEAGTVTLAPIRWPEEKLRRSVTKHDPRGRTEPPNERFALAMSTPDFFMVDEQGEPRPESPLKSRQGTPDLLPDQQGRFWFELLPEVDRVEWRFWDPAKKLWVDQAPAGRPPLVELLLFLPGRTTTPVRAVFATELK